VNKLVPVFLVIAALVSACTPPAVATGVKAEPTNTASVPARVATSVPSPTITRVPVSIDEIIEWEMRGSFDFFWERVNLDENSPGYGLIRDRYPGSEGIASIAAVGFGLTAYPIGVEKHYISFDEGFDRANRTLDTLLGMERKEGFYYHFVDMQTGKRAWNSEVSSIDTAILLMGVLSAGEYFGGEVEVKATQIYDAVNWPWFIDLRGICLHGLPPGERL